MVPLQISLLASATDEEKGKRGSFSTGKSELDSMYLFRNSWAAVKGISNQFLSMQNLFLQTSTKWNNQKKTSSL